ncbi:hypothetical protein BSKO_03270 [Bryopsis sp. KO-2023]|nr:hypothetical protein BSKO_03270 [Bryopsis sp. KO-2023]
MGGAGATSNAIVKGNAFVCCTDRWVDHIRCGTLCTVGNPMHSYERSHSSLECQNCNRLIFNATLEGDSEKVKGQFLSLAGTNVDFKSDNEGTPSIDAADFGRLELVDFLLESERFTAPPTLPRRLV